MGDYNEPTSPVVLSGTELGELTVNGGESYLLDVKDLRRTRPEFYAMRSAIQVLRGQAETYLDEFFQKARDKGLTVCVLIHGFTSDHATMQKAIGTLDALKSNPNMVILYIDWDTQVVKKASLFFLQGTSNIITNGINNAYDIHLLLQKAIQKHARRNPEDGTDKLSVIVLAHSMGSHVAEAFIQEHESINLRGVIYFNPHADHTFYNLQHVEHMYMSRTKTKGFVLVFASARDRVLSGSLFLQNFFRSFARTLFGKVFNFQNTYIRPLGCSWENYRDKATNDGHRVVVLHMKHKPSYRFAFWYPFHDFMNHWSYKYKPAKEIANGAIELAMTQETVDISQVQALIKNEHYLDPAEENGFTIKRPYGYECEYVNMETENENTKIELRNNCAKIKPLPFGSEDPATETTPLVMA